MTGVTAEIAARRERRKEAKRRITDSVRLGPESLGLAPPDKDDKDTIAQAADDLGRSHD